MKKRIFTGAGVAIITPMNPDMSVNFDKLKEIIDFQIENGTDAIIICGTPGKGRRCQMQSTARRSSARSNILLKGSR